MAGRGAALLVPPCRPLKVDMATSGFRLAFIAACWIFFFELAKAATDPSDAEALGVLYSSLNNPQQLIGWKTDGWDPCGESWKGVECAGSSVSKLLLSGLGLNGTLGYLLSDLRSLKTLDVSNNNIHDIIPYQLPPNLLYLNLANNNLSGNLPYSITSMASLQDLNTSHNNLSMMIADIFANLGNLSTVDLSFNNFSGDLPSSFSSLSNLSNLYLQHNQLTGTVNVLSSLELDALNIADNHFTGWIPREFSSIKDLNIRGNSFDNGPAPPPPPYLSPPPARSHKRNRTHPSSGSPNGSVVTYPSEGERDDKGLPSGAMVGVIVGSTSVGLFALLLLIFCIWRNMKTKMYKTSSLDGSRTSGPSVKHTVSNEEKQEQTVKNVSPIISVKASPSENSVEIVNVRNGSLRRQRIPITATSYTVAFLQTATNSFSQENIIGEGTLGRVYRAEFPNGKVFAVKKIDSAALSLQEEDNFLEAVSNMSRLRNPNIVALLGYCAEHGQRLLIYDYVGNGTLHDMLHFSDQESKKLTWNARVRIALGTARALEYLHEVCLPSTVHRNFKSANILLDEELNPHLSDCGLAALTPNTERQISTQFVGSFGYSAPEFAMSGVYTVKSDVYSFGVVMLELLTGRKPLDSSRVRSEQSLARWATPQLHDIDALSKMVDPSLNGMYPAKSLSRFADVVALCVQPEPEFRPPMSEVVQSLVRLMQRASIVKRRSSDDYGFPYRIPEHEATDVSF